MGGSARSRRRVEPTDEWEQIELLCAWPEQRDYELVRPLVLFGSSAARRAAETGVVSERTLQRRVARFEAEGMESLFGSEAARRNGLPPSVRRLVVDLKAEYPGFNPNEIANACYVRFSRRPARKTVKRVLAEEPAPLRFVRRFAPYHEIPANLATAVGSPDVLVNPDRARCPRRVVSGGPPAARPAPGGISGRLWAAAAPSTGR